MNLFYPYNRGALYTALIVLYSLTAGIAGYVASSYYKQVRSQICALHGNFRYRRCSTSSTQAWNQAWLKLPRKLDVSVLAVQSQ